jgi:hypothetical protein
VDDALGHGCNYTRVPEDLLRRLWAWHIVAVG